MAYIYLIQSLNESTSWIYVGSTENVENRVRQHNSGKVRSTRFRRPYKLIYVEEFATISEARKRERDIKRSRILKESLVKDNIGPIV